MKMIKQTMIFVINKLKL